MSDGRVKASSSFIAGRKRETASKCKSTSEPQMGENDSDSAFIEPLSEAFIEPLSEHRNDDEAPKRGRSTGDEAFKAWEAWENEKDSFLAELLHLEGRDSPDLRNCSECQQNEALYECADCHGRRLLCKLCIIACHATCPLHRILRWNGIFFERSSLKELGLRIQLGHSFGEDCPNPEPATGDDFVILDHQGVHEVGLDFCGCGKTSATRALQLIRRRLYPATVTNPKTAATVRALEILELLSYESKVSIYEFYQSISRLTDNTGTRVIKDRYPSLLRMIRQWRFLKMAKRAGRGHDPGGLAATKPGECAVLCPACPQPGKNMADGWQEAEPDQRFLHALFIGIDANFRLKRKHVSSQEVDPGLSRGHAYVVEETEYKEYLQKYQGETEPKSSCSRHDAVNLSESKHSRGFAATGIATVDCVRHDMKRPLSMGDLQKGERYCNIDYLLYKTLMNTELVTFVISYDIACQWSVNLCRRLLRIDNSSPLLDDKVLVKFVVPKFHMSAHIQACQTRYSLNWTKGVGRADGEGLERNWSESNHLASSTREMGPGSRRDTFDVHNGDHNHKKIIGLGVSLEQKIKNAAADAADHVIAHMQLEMSLPEETVTKWRTAIEAWENDPSQPNPFESISVAPTLASVRRDLAEEEARNLREGRDFSLDEKISPSVLISSGIELEAEQRSVKVLASKIWQHSQDRQITRLQIMENALRRKIEAFVKVQQLYMPSIVKLRHKASQEDNTELPEARSYELPLWLPSQVQSLMPVDHRLSEIEWKLRLAQAHDALDAIRRHLRMRTHLYKFKDRFVRGQGPNTRALNTISTIQAKVDSAADDYRAAYRALVALSMMLNKVGWQDKLLPLKKDDLREMAQPEPGKSEALRVEWCKSRARAAHFSEEVELLREEMSRVLRFLQWQEDDWHSKGKLASYRNLPNAQLEPLRAYAERQASLRRGIRLHFAHLWKGIPLYIQQMEDVITRFKASRTIQSGVA